MTDNVTELPPPTDSEDLRRIADAHDAKVRKLNAQIAAKHAEKVRAAVGDATPPLARAVAEAVLYLLERTTELDGEMGQTMRAGRKE